MESSVLNILLDIAHPVDSHFYKKLAPLLEQDGHNVFWAGRHKEVTNALLQKEHAVLFSTVPRQTRFGQAVELIQRTKKLIMACRRHNISLILTKNPTGALAARTLAIPAVYNTTDGKASGLHYQIARYTARLITCEIDADCIFDHKHLIYRGHLHASYLHPKYFSPDPDIKQALGLHPGENYYILRFSAYNASHDHGHRGLDDQDKKWLVSYLKTKGKVFISSEVPLCEDMAQYAVPLPAEKFLDVLCGASGVIGDGISVAIEAALLGTPSICVSSYIMTLKYAKSLAEKLEHLHISSPIPSQKNPDHLSLRTWIEHSLRYQNATDVSLEDFWRQQVDLIEWYRDLVRKFQTDEI
jgi:predicted glycosyltransferase